MSLAADRSLRSLVDRGDVEGVFFFHGDAERLRDDAARALVEAAIDPATRDFNLDIYRGADVTPEALAASLGEDRGTLEDINEPYLLQIGFIQRTPRGRIATERAYEHLGVERAQTPDPQGTLLD